MSSYGTYVFFVDENTLGEWLVKQARIKDVSSLSGLADVDIQGMDSERERYAAVYDLDSVGVRGYGRQLAAFPSGQSVNYFCC